VEPGEFTASRDKGCEIRGERDAREFALQVVGEALPIIRVVQECVDVVEDVPLGDSRVGVVVTEVLERPVRDVLAAVGAVGVVGVEGEALGATLRQEIDNVT
jgi:DNA helicase HerA-like ATPase